MRGTPLFRRPCESRDLYAVPSRGRTELETFHNNERWWLWVPAFAGTTWEDSIVKQQIRLRAPRRDAPELCIYFRPLEGVGNAGCPLHPQPRVQCVGSTRVVTTVAPGSPGIPARNGFNGLFRALPGDRALLPPSLADIASLRPVGPTHLRELDASVGASGPHDFAVRSNRLSSACSLSLTDS